MVDNFGGDHIAWGKLGQRVEGFHEAGALGIDKHCSFAANCLRDEHIATACAGKIQHSGVELHKFDIARGCPGAQGHGQAISGGNGRIGGQRPQRADTAGGQHDVIGKPATNLAIMEAAHSTHGAIGGGQQVNRAGMGDDVDSAITGCAQESFLNFPPRLVPGVNDAA